MATSKRSKSSRKSPTRPVDPAVRRQARELAAKYQVIVRRDDELGALSGRGVEIPNALGFGETADEVIAEVRGNMEALVIHMLERGETPPLMGKPQRTEQINLRLTRMERETIESLARAAGQGVSDYIRTVAIGR